MRNVNRRLLVVAAAFAAILAAAPLGQATEGGDWTVLRTTILAEVPPGPAQAELLAGVDAIEYQEAYGSYDDVVDAYDAFVDLVVGHYDEGNITKLQGDAVVASWQDASQGKKVEILADVRLELVLFKKCDFLECTADGRVCLTFQWQYWNKKTGMRGAGKNCIGR